MNMKIICVSLAVISIGVACAYNIEDTSVEDTAEHIVPEAEVEHLGDADETELTELPKWLAGMGRKLADKWKECKSKRGRSKWGRWGCMREFRSLMKKKKKEKEEAAKREENAKAAAKAAIAKKKTEKYQKKVYKEAHDRNAKKKCVCEVTTTGGKAVLYKGKSQLSVTRGDEEKSVPWSGKKFGTISCKGCSGVKLYDDDSWGVKDVTLFDAKWNKKNTQNCCIQKCEYKILSSGCFLHDLCNDVKKITLYNSCGPKRL